MRVALLRILTLALILAAIVFRTAAGADAKDYPLRDVRAGEAVSLSTALPSIGRGDIVFAGERHDNVRDHQFQLALVRGLHESGIKLAVGLEMIPHERQKILDRWESGEISEREFIGEFRRDWGEFWLYYRPIFIYCRDNSIPLVGLNASREITRKVAREGFASLTPEEVGTLPPVVCDLDPAYESFLRRVFGGHGSREAEPGFTRFCEAQAVWDTALAWRAIEYLKSAPGSRMVVLCGGVHAWRPAAPARVAKFVEGVTTVSILPLDNDEDPKSYGTADCDWLLLPE